MGFHMLVFPHVCFGGGGFSSAAIGKHPWPVMRSFNSSLTCTGIGLFRRDLMRWWPGWRQPGIRVLYCLAGDRAGASVLCRGTPSHQHHRPGAPSMRRDFVCVTVWRVCVLVCVLWTFYSMLFVHYVFVGQYLSTLQPDANTPQFQATTLSSISLFCHPRSATVQTDIADFAATDLKPLAAGS